VQLLPVETVYDEDFVERYRPDFRVRGSIHCSDGSIVSRVEACDCPDSEIIRRLAQAVDAPKRSDGEGGIKVNGTALPGFFRTWSKVAFGDLLKSLPEEEAAELGEDSSAGEDFRRMVRDAMLSEVQFGDVIKGTNVTQVERRSLIDWCVKWAKPGPWRSIRSKKCWCKSEVQGNGLIVLRVAIRQELFAQVHADRRLCGMTRNTFTILAARYRVGNSHRDDRPHGLAAVVLDHDFVIGLTEGMTDPENLVDSEKAKCADGPGQISEPSEMT
jgi:hypothetical protein